VAEAVAQAQEAAAAELEAAKKEVSEQVRLPGAWVWCMDRALGGGTVCCGLEGAFGGALERQAQRRVQIGGSAGGEVQRRALGAAPGACWGCIHGFLSYIPLVTA
jgi:hypothetical protein